jgi:hypothetical protein
VHNVTKEMRVYRTVSLALLAILRQVEEIEKTQRDILKQLG